jgi:hypothetical protein
MQALTAYTVCFVEPLNVGCALLAALVFQHLLLLLLMLSCLSNDRRMLCEARFGYMIAKIYVSLQWYFCIVLHQA